MPVKGEGRLVNQGELASIFGVQALTIRAWERKGCPVEKRGGAGKPSLYNTAAVARWREEQAAAAAAGDLSAMDIEEAKRRKLAAEATIAEMDLAVKRGELIPIDVIGAQVEDEYASVRANFMAMAGEIAADLEHRSTIEIEEMIASKVTEILDGLSADGQYATEDAAGEGESDRTSTAAEA